MPTDHLRKGHTQPRTHPLLTTVQEVITAAPTSMIPWVCAWWSQWKANRCSLVVRVLVCPALSRGFDAQSLKSWVWRYTLATLETQNKIFLCCSGLYIIPNQDNPLKVLSLPDCNNQTCSGPTRDQPYQVKEGEWTHETLPSTVELLAIDRTSERQNHCP